MVPLLGSAPTVALDRIVCDAAQHSELRVLPNTETFPHPGEEVRQAIVTTLHPFRDTGASAGKRERRDAVGSKRYVRVGIRKVLLRLQDIAPTFRVQATNNLSIRKQSKGRDLDPDLELARDELAHWRQNLSRTREDDEGSWLRDLQVDRLS